MTSIIKHYFPIAYNDTLGFLKVQDKETHMTLGLEKIFRKTLTIGYVPIDIALNAVFIPIRFVQGIILKIINIYRRSNYFLQKNYYISGNVSGIEEADVVCLGEMHYADRHRKINGSVINRYSKLNDVVLNESNSKFRLIPDISKPVQTKYVRTGTILHGWDSLSNDEKIKILKISKFGVFFFFGSSIFELFRKKNLESASNLTHNYFNIFGTLFFLYIMNTILGTTFYKRNENMCKTIELNLSARRKVFVLGGAAHFPTFHIWSPLLSIISLNPFLIPTNRYLEGKKYLVLTPKNMLS